LFDVWVICSSFAAVIYSLKLFDTDTNEEVWSEDAAHHGVVYEAKWSKDDRYLLTCSGDGTSKVWDLLDLLFRTNVIQQTAALVSHKQHPSSPTERATDRSVVSESNASLQGLLGPKHTTPALLHTLISARPVFVYSGVFQETSSAANTIKATFSNASVGLSGTNNLHISTERFAEVERSPLPRIITGSSDGRLRVWDGAQMVGYVCVKDKEATTESGEQDLSPHEGQVNSIVIDERSK
jgi:WD40 repeat protein